LDKRLGWILLLSGLKNKNVRTNSPELKTCSNPPGWEITQAGFSPTKESISTNWGDCEINVVERNQKVGYPLVLERKSI